MRIGLTVGDPAGIGPEITAKALSRCMRFGELCIYGDLAAVERAGGVLADVRRVEHRSADVEPGKPDPAAAAGVVAAIRAAAQDCLDGRLDAMVTAPISKQVLGEAGFSYPGHTELLQEVAGRGQAVMLLVGDGLRVGLATVHCALREVPDRLRRDALVEVLAVMHHDLVHRFAIDARGPLPADSLFHRAVSGEFDCVLAMYHDQGLAPLKLHAFGRAVNVTLGLPFIRTSVDHGTAFDIAGRDQANPQSLIEAVSLARELVCHERARKSSS